MDTQKQSPASQLIQGPFQLEYYLGHLNPHLPIAIDTETNGLDENAPSAKLLGISLSQAGIPPTYIVLQHYDKTTDTFTPSSVPLPPLVEFLRAVTTAYGANYAFDSDWIKVHLGVEVKFTFDTQIAWHHADAPYAQRSYGLKALQKDLLGWTTSNDAALHANIKANGGDAKKGQFYYADLEVLGEYAALDALATRLGAELLLPFFHQHDYFSFHNRTCAYRALLRRSSKAGITVRMGALEDWILQANKTLAHLEQAFYDSLGETILTYVHRAMVAKAASYKTDAGRSRFLASPPPKVNPDSNKVLGQIFYNILGEPIREWTESRQPAVHKTALKQMSHPAAAILLERNALKKCLEYAEAYYTAVGPDNKMHPSFNVTGTLTGRASGFAPNIHQMPINEESLMRCFTVPAGRVGIGGDLTSVEPFFTAFFSDDSTLLKVYRDGLGDIYLDLALELFPTNLELAQLYNPLESPDDGIKSQFKTVRQISKLVHLASAYGAGGKKIACILTQNGFETSEDEGRRLHRLYWKKFKKVKDLEAGLYELNRQDGLVRTLFGRIIRLPDAWCKDLMNRFIQSTGHDALMEWVFEIDRLSQERGIPLVPFILDWHDATYWHCAPEHTSAAAAILSDALMAVNTRYELPYPLKAHIKSFNSLAEIK